jgi:tRNA pseudouridine65 synthase
MVPTTFSILYEDDHLIAINKPNGILVHRTKISEDTTFVLQLLRNQLGHRIYPIHRLDRGTSGVLVFGKTSEAAAAIAAQMRAGTVGKFYTAIIRGYVEEEALIDYALKHPDRGVVQEAQTRYRRLAQVEMPYAISRYPTSRYSLVTIELLTGRRHQIRRHFAHLRHPVIGDHRYGDIKHNKFFKTQLGIPIMLLHAQKMVLQHPNSKDKLTIEAPLPEAFSKVEAILGFASVK